MRVFYSILLATICTNLWAASGEFSLQNALPSMLYFETSEVIYSEPFTQEYIERTRKQYLAEWQQYDSKNSTKTLAEAGKDYDESPTVPELLMKKRWYLLVRVNSQRGYRMRVFTGSLDSRDKSFYVSGDEERDLAIDDRNSLKEDQWIEFHSSSLLKDNPRRGRVWIFPYKKFITTGDDVYSTLTCIEGSTLYFNNEDRPDVSLKRVEDLVARYPKILEILKASVN